MSSRRANEQGFTLIEVLISVVIMAFISLGIYQMTTETFRLREVLSQEGGFYNGIRMAMDIVGRDVAAIYSPTMARLPEPTPSATPGNSNGYGAPQPVDPAMQAILQTDAGRTSQFWLAATDKTGLRPSHFIGTDSKMSFVTNSHVRIYKDAPESVFAQVSYELVHDTDNPNDPDALMLVRKENPDAFDDDDSRTKQYEHVYPLLHGIKTLRFRYWSKEKDQNGRGWVTSWDNDKEDFKEKFPDMVEVTFEVNGPAHLSFDGHYEFRPEEPLRGLDPSS